MYQKNELYRHGKVLSVIMKFYWSGKKIINKSHGSFLAVMYALKWILSLLGGCSIRVKWGPMEHQFHEHHDKTISSNRPVSFFL